MADRVVMLLRPFAEEMPVQAARHPGVAPGMHLRMPLLDRVFELVAEFALRHGVLLSSHLLEHRTAVPARQLRLSAPSGAILAAAESS